MSRFFRFETAVLLLYLLLILLFSLQHDVWRDEVRAYSIATAGGGLSALLERLKNEGHPVLWYLLLRLFAGILGGSIALKAASIAVAGAAMAVFLYRAPFPRWIKLLWPFGFFPLYEYSVSCRNYGLTMLLLFSFCALFPNRYRRPVEAGAVVGLLALSSAYGLLLSLSLAAGILFELLWIRRETKPAAASKQLACGAALALSGIVWSIQQMTPDSSSTVTKVFELTPNTFVTALLASIGSHGSAFHNGFYLPVAAAVPLLLLAIYVFTLRKPFVPVFLFCFVSAIEMLHRTVYSAAALRHQGMLFVAVIAALWIERQLAEQLRFNVLPLKMKPQQFQTAANWVIAVLMLPQIYLGQQHVRRDLNSILSSAPQLAQLVRADSRLKQAIIAGEPDFNLETLPYYLENRLYFARQQRFARVASFTTAAEQKLTLGQLLERVVTLRLPAAEASKESSEVLLLLPETLDPAGGVLKMNYGTEFTYSPEDLHRLEAQAEQLAVLSQAEGDEIYSVYRIK